MSSTCGFLFCFVLSYFVYSIIPCTDYNYDPSTNFITEFLFPCFIYASNILHTLNYWPLTVVELIWAVYFSYSFYTHWYLEQFLWNCSFRWIPQATLVQVLAWCHQATSQYLNQGQPSFMSALASPGCNDKIFMVGYLKTLAPSLSAMVLICKIKGSSSPKRNDFILVLRNYWECWCIFYVS